MDQPLIDALTKMAARGLKVDMQALQAYATECLTKRDEIGVQLYTNHAIKSPGSRKEVHERLQCGMEQSKAVLLKKNDPRLHPIIEWRALQREVSYAKTFQDFCKDGRVRWEWKEASSGRLYTKDYNVQAISAKARKTIVPDNGWFVCLDYRQAEFRMAAILSKDPQMAADIASGDAYDILAKIFFPSIQDSRDKIKVMVLGIMYGMNPDGISQRLDIPVEAAKQTLAGLQKRYAGLHKWTLDVMSKASKTREVTTLDGFTRQLTEEDMAVLQRQSVNTSVQGSMADIMKRAIRDVAAKQPGIDMACAVHDSLIVDTKGPDLDAGLLKGILEYEIEGVKLELKVKTGKTWGDVTEDKPDLLEARL